MDCKTSSQTQRTDRWLPAAEGGDGRNGFYKHHHLHPDHPLKDSKEAPAGPRTQWSLGASYQSNTTILFAIRKHVDLLSLRHSHYMRSCVLMWFVERNKHRIYFQSECLCVCRKRMREGIPQWACLSDLGAFSEITSLQVALVHYAFVQTSNKWSSKGP